MTSGANILPGVQPEKVRFSFEVRAPKDTTLTSTHPYGVQAGTSR